MKQGEKSIWSQAFVVLFVLTIFDQMSFLCTRTIISKYALDLGFNNTMAGFIAGALSIAAMFSRPVAGKILGKSVISKRTILRVMVAASFAIVLCYILVRNFIPLMIIRILNGITYGVSGTVELTMASDALPDEVMGRGIAIFGLGNIIGLAIAPSIASFLYDRYSPNVLFIFCAVTSVMAMGITFFIPDASEKKAVVRQEKAERKAGGIKAFLESTFAVEALVPSLLNFASQMAYASISAFIIVYGGVKGWDNIALFYTVYSVALFVFKPVNGRLYDKKGLLPLVVFGNASFALGILMIAFTNRFELCLLAAVFCAYGYGGAISTFQAEALKSTTYEKHGVASGTYFTLNDFGGFFGASLAGVVASIFGYSKMYIIFTIPLVIAVLGYSYLWINENGKGAACRKIEKTQQEI